MTKNGWSYLFGEKSTLFSGDAWGTGSAADNRMGWSNGSASTTPEATPARRTMDGYEIKTNALGQDYITTTFGEDRLLDSAGRPVDPNAGQSGNFYGNAGASLWSSGSDLYGNNLETSASSLYGHTPLASTASMSSFYGTTETAGTTGSIWGSADTGTSNSFWGGSTTNTGGSIWGSSSNSDSAGSGSGSGWCAMTGGMNNNSGDGGNSGGGLGW